MNITGNTSTCVITANTPFIQSGVTSGNADSITITDLNGMSVTSCFGLSTDITEFNTFTGDTCGNVLEITITQGVVDEVICDYTGTTLQPDGLILLTYSGGSTSLNVHPECCTSMDDNYVPEIGNAGYYVCRWRELFDPTDCNNYEANNTFEGDYMIFNISTGGTTTIVPSAECCYNIDLVDELTNVGVKCKEVVVPVCAEYAVEDNIPEIGDVEFTVLSTGLTTFEVPTLECCTINGLSGRELINGKWTCYKALNPPTVSITLNSNCCEEIVRVAEPETGICSVYEVFNEYEGGTVNYINCDGFPDEFIVDPRLQQGVGQEFCALRIVSLIGDAIIPRPNGVATCDPTKPVQQCQEWVLFGYDNRYDQFADDAYIEFIDCYGEERQLSAGYGQSAYFTSSEIIRVDLGSGAYWDRNSIGDMPLDGPNGKLTSEGYLTWDGTRWV